MLNKSKRRGKGRSKLTLQRPPLSDPEPAAKSPAQPPDPLKLARMLGHDDSGRIVNVFGRPFTLVRGACVEPDGAHYCFRIDRSKRIITIDDQIPYADLAHVAAVAASRAWEDEFGVKLGGKPDEASAWGESKGGDQ